MKKLRITSVIVFLCGVLNGYGQVHKILNSYSGQNLVSASGSITLTDGFHVPFGSAFHALISSSNSCEPLALDFSSNRNYIAEFRPKINLLYSGYGNNFVNKNVCEVNVGVDYFDGLGRMIQSVKVKANADGNKDIVTPVTYDAYGRQTKAYLPYASSSANGSFKASALTDQTAFYLTPPLGVMSTQYPYSSNVLEASPLNRLLEQGAPGVSWQLSSSGVSGSGHTGKIEYQINKTADGPDLVLYSANAVTTSGQTHHRTLTNTGTYAEGKLSVTISKDENWISGKAGTVWEYTNKQGRVVVKRIWETDNICLSTYYVYDLEGHLSFVLPPAALPDAGTISTDDMERYCYQYRYDGKNRLIEKKFPGKGWEWMVYGKRDELIMSQDAVQRTANTWLFSKYDEKGRIVMTGELNSSDDRIAMQTASNSYNGAAWEKYTGVGTYGYDNMSYPTSFSKVLAVNYYDRYNFLNNSLGSPGTGQRTDGLSLETGSLVNVLGTSTMLLSVRYYDDKCRMIQQKSQNHLGGIDVTDIGYNFVDEIISRTRTHTANSVTTTIAETYTYDHVGRKLKTMQSINGATATTLTELVYNELGQLKEKKLHDNLQSTTYSYNERGWMKKAESPQFSYELKYNDSSMPQYNGNIANQNWGAGTSYPNVFTYGYDKLNRLTSGASTGITMSEVLTYDKMGNIATLNRDNAGVGTYNYTGNQLNSIIGGGLANGSYAYDLNGNATADGRTGVTLSYNYLSLPVTATTTGLNLAYIYDAKGIKLTRNTNGSVTQYAGGIQYKPDGTIDFIQTEAGTARRSGNSYSYEYTLTDHLGNARYSFDIYSGAPRRIQQQDYYAFGKVATGQYVSGDKNAYLYNGKELQEELGQLDYGARFYDPVIGRWNVIDPLAEKSRRFSPYVYGNNNPIRFIDPDGMESKDWVKYELDGKSYAKWDDNVTDQASAEKLYGQGSLYAGKDGTATTASGYKINLNSDKSWSYDAPLLSARSDGPSLSDEIRKNMPMLNMAEGIATGTALVTSGSIGAVESGGAFLVNSLARRASFAEGLLEKGTNLVYQGIDAAGIVRYVGITERAAEVRFAEHLNAIGTGREFLDYRIIQGATGLAKGAAKVMEQNLINNLGLMKNGGQLLNKINSIAPKNWAAFGITP